MNVDELYLNRKGYTRKIFHTEFERTSREVAKLKREDLVPKSSSDKVEFAKRQLKCTKLRAIAISEISHRVFPKLIKGQKVLTAADFILPSGGEMDKGQTAVFLNDYYRGKKIWGEVKSFINFVVNNTFSTSESFDILNLETGEIISLEKARENLKDSQVTNLEKTQNLDERAKLSSTAIDEREDKHAAVLGHKENLIHAIVNAVPDDANLEFEGDVKPATALTLTDGDQADIDKANFRRGILEAHRKATKEGSAFYLQNYLSNFPNARLYAKWESSVASYDKYIEEVVESTGATKKA